MNRYKLDNYKRRYTIDAYECEHCTMPGTQIAHRIAETKTNLAKYGVKVVNHFLIWLLPVRYTVIAGSTSGTIRANATPLQN
jgi:hypothetical protein